MSSPHTPRHRALIGRGFVVCLSLIGLVAGVAMVVLGAGGGVPDAAPMPGRTFSVQQPLQGDKQASPSRGRPEHLTIPRLGVNAPLEARPVHGGELVIPGDPAKVAVWEGGAALDAAAGTTLLAGHVDINGELGALHELASVTPGERIRTTDERGDVTEWSVTSLHVAHKDDLPTFSAKGPRVLVLVTCGGPVEKAGGRWTYRDNVIVSAVPITLSEG